MNIILYCFIFIAKMLEVSIGVTRIVLITRGERVLGACLGFIEVIIWVALVSTVLTDVSENPIKVVVYAAGFAMGNYVGSRFEEYLGIGNVRVEVIIMADNGCKVTDAIRSKGYAVTVIEGKGMEFNRHVLLMNIRRKDYQEIVKLIKACEENVVITINDIKPVYGGYGMLKR